MAKQAVQSSLDLYIPAPTHQVLTRASAAVFIGRVKQTTDVAQEVRYILGHNEAEKFYTTPLGERDVRGVPDKYGGLGWTQASFDVIDWKARDATLHGKLQLYKQWLAK